MNFPLTLYTLCTEVTFDNAHINVKESVERKGKEKSSYFTRKVLKTHCLNDLELPERECHFKPMKVLSQGCILIR